MNTESSSQAGWSRDDPAPEPASSVQASQSTDPIDVVLATQDDEVRSEIRSWLERAGGFDLAAEKVNATQALGATLFHSPRVCLLGIDLPGELDARIQSIRTERPETRIGILARSADQPGLLRAVLAGADGVLLTSDPPETFIAELSALARGERVIPPEGSEDGGAQDAAETAQVLSAAEPPRPAPESGSAPARRAITSTEPPIHQTEVLAAADAQDSWLKATVLYLPRFLHHLRRRLRADMPLPVAWTSARERMWDYR